MQSMDEIKEFVNEEVSRLADEHTLAELEAQVDELQQERQDIRDEFGVESLVDLHARRDDASLPAERQKLFRNVAQTWEAIDTDLFLVQQAIARHGDTKMSDSEVEAEAREIVKESLEMGDFGPITSVDGECSRCGDDAVWRDPETGDLLCEEHAKELFTERHG